MDRNEQHIKYRETLSRLFIDISKIILTGIVIGGLSPIFTGSYSSVNYIMIAIGLVIFLLAAWIGCRILKP